MTRHAFVLMATALVGSGVAVTAEPASREPSPTRGAAPAVRAGAAAEGFEENLGQAGPGGGFLWRGAGAMAHVSAGGATLDGGGGRIRLRFIGADRTAAVQGVERLPGISSYFRGSDPAAWVTGARRFERLRVSSAYPGIDVMWRTAAGGLLEYDLVLAPGADPGAARVRFDGAVPSLAPGGDLLLSSPNASLVQRAPVAFQRVDGGVRGVPAGYVISPTGEVGLHLGAYDRSLPLVVDPVLEHSTFLGGSFSDISTAVAASPDGTSVITGYAQSTDFRNQTSGFGERFITDVFVTKLGPDGSLVYSVFIGGDEPELPAGLELGCDSPAYFTPVLRGCGEDFGHAVALDAQGNAYVGGSTTSGAFPTVGAAQPAFAGGYSDSFVAKLSPAGDRLVYSTYLGGGAQDEARALTVDGAGRAVVAGATNSTDYPTAGAIQGSMSGDSDAFVTRLSPSGGAIERSTYLGGAGMDLVDGVAARADGGIVLTGWTGSADFPTRDPIQPDFGGGQPGDFSPCPCDGFVTALTPVMDGLAFSTFLGGTENDYGRDLVVDENGRAHVVGYTLSTDFPTAEPWQEANAGPADGFVSTFAPDGRELEFSTYLGGEHPEDAGAIDVDRCGNLYVAGYTPSPNFPTYRSMQGANPGSTKIQNDAYIVKLDPDRELVYSTLLGGRTFDTAYGLAVDDAGTVHVGGWTGSDNFPTANAVQEEWAGEIDSTLSAISDEPCDPDEEEQP